MIPYPSLKTGVTLVVATIKGISSVGVRKPLGFAEPGLPIFNP